MTRIETLIATARLVVNDADDAGCDGTTVVDGDLMDDLRDCLNELECVRLPRMAERRPGHRFFSPSAIAARTHPYNLQARIALEQQLADE